MQATGQRFNLLRQQSNRTVSDLLFANKKKKEIDFGHLLLFSVCVKDLSKGWIGCKSFLK